MRVESIHKIFFVLVFSIAFIGMMYPYGGYPLFSVSILLWGIATLITYRGESINLPFNFFFLLQFVFFLSILWEPILYKSLKKDIINIIAFDIFLILILLNIHSKEQLTKYMRSGYFALTFIGVIIALIGFYKYYYLLQGVELESFKAKADSYPWGTSLVSDYNMFSLGLIISLFAVYNLIKENKNLYINMLFLLSGLIILTAILLSGSRRGMIIGVLILLFCFFLLIKYLLSSTILMMKRLKVKRSAVVILILALFAYNEFSVNLEFEEEINYSKIEELVVRAQGLLTLMEGGETSASDRLKRWDFAYDIIENDYSTVNIFLGNGFEYLKLYGKEFEKSDSIEDYPHNIFITHLLFSGIIGFIVLMLFLLEFIYIIQVKIYREYSFLSFGSILVLLYVLVSNNTIFSSKALMFFIILCYCSYIINNRRANENIGHSIKQV